jgi:hypothetical protein
MGVAAARLGRRFVGVDIWDKAVELARDAIEAQRQPAELCRERGTIWRTPRDREALRKRPAQVTP